jgi:hypothetical protein
MAKIERVKLKFIDNDPNLGVDYDWDLIAKTYKSLGVPPEYDITEILPLGNDALKWYIANSERSVGKTTNVLLVGMVMYALYGTVTQLIRHTIDKASYYETLFDTIVAYNQGQYIKKLTNGEYDSVKYHWKAFYYQRREKNGKYTRADDPFCVSLAADECYNLCSFYEAPRGDWIVLDECFNETNKPEEFVHFCHLVKTIVRERISDKIIVLGNNLDINNIWYRQLMIHNEVRKLRKGQSKIVKTSEGMPIFVVFMENRLPQKRRVFNKLHFGFNNPQLNAITGNGNWNVKMYPQACMLKERERICRGIFFSYHDDLFLEAEFVNSKSGIYVLINPSLESTSRQGDVLYTLLFPNADNELYFGHDKLSRKIIDFIRKKRVVYADNETGDLFAKYIFEALGVKI